MILRLLDKNETYHIEMHNYVLENPQVQFWKSSTVKRKKMLKTMIFILIKNLIIIFILIFILLKLAQYFLINWKDINIAI